MEWMLSNDNNKLAIKMFYFTKLTSFKKIYPVLQSTTFIFLCFNLLKSHLTNTQPK